jgi:hypothetical protein
MISGPVRGLHAAEDKVGVLLRSDLTRLEHASHRELPLIERLLKPKIPFGTSAPANSPREVPLRRGGIPGGLMQGPLHAWIVGGTCEKERDE